MTRALTQRQAELLTRLEALFLTENSVERSFLEGRVPAHALDGEEYNRRAVEEFVTAIGADA